MKMQDADVRKWLIQWQSLIAEGNFEAARNLFEEDVIGYGTVAIRAEGLDALVSLQWKSVWTRTSNFVFVLNSISTWQEGDMVAAAVGWVSTGEDSVTGESFEREGRATIIWRRRGRELRAVHTHFSLNPAAERFLPR